MLLFQENVENDESERYFHQINKSTRCLNIYFGRDGTIFKKQVSFIEKQHNLAGNPVLIRCFFILRSFCQFQAICYLRTRLSSKSQLKIPYRTQNINSFRSEWIVRRQRKKARLTSYSRMLYVLAFFRFTCVRV